MIQQYTVHDKIIYRKSSETAEYFVFDCTLDLINNKFIQNENLDETRTINLFIEKKLPTETYKIFILYFFHHEYVNYYCTIHQVDIFDFLKFEFFEMNHDKMNFKGNLLVT